MKILIQINSINQFDRIGETLITPGKQKKELQWA